jgi:GTP pyrophosphokinase
MEANPNLDRIQVEKAVRFVAVAHEGQFRKSGKPYSEHPYAVAQILADIRMDTATVVAGLLHDVAEDTEHGLQEIEAGFGADVAFMVDAVTKITSLQAKGNQTLRKAETYRKFVISLAKQPRVIMIKIADRLHNMRTLEFMKPDRQKAIATETLELYAPLTHRFGFYGFKFELEDLSFKYLNPERYNYIKRRLDETAGKRNSYIESVVAPLQMKLNLEQMIDCSVKGRVKNIYSIWNKMQSRNCDFDDIFDLFAIRVVVSEITECYLTLGCVHNLWIPVQNRFKDYIASPKSNLYQSIHTTVVGPEGKLVEVQIRTRDMDETAEKGFAAHWAYKFETRRSGQELDWLSQMAKAQADIPDSTEFLEFLHADVRPLEVSVLTPQGKELEFPYGATVLDFAFAVHTDMGLHCVGARIDGQVMPVDKPLVSGSTIHILRSPSQEPSPNWLHIVRTPRAQNALRRYFRDTASQQANSLGKKIWERELRLLNVPIDKAPQDMAICDYFKVQSVDEFLEALGKGNTSLTALSEFLQPYAGDASKRFRSLLWFGTADNGEKMPVQIGAEERLLIHFPTCCNPVPGDEIKGVLVPGKGIEVHKAGCPKVKDAAKERKIPVEWKRQEGGGGEFEVRLTVEGVNRWGIHEEIVKTIGKMSAWLEKGTLASKGSVIRDTFRLTVKNSMQVDSLVGSINKIAGVREVKRG